MFPNLNAELARAGKNGSDIASWISCSNRTANNKLAGKTEFTLSEIIAIADHFPGMSLSYLFSIRTNKQQEGG